MEFCADLSQALFSSVYSVTSYRASRRRPRRRKMSFDAKAPMLVCVCVRVCVCLLMKVSEGTVRWTLSQRWRDGVVSEGEGGMGEVAGGTQRVCAL